MEKAFSVNTPFFNPKDTLGKTIDAMPFTYTLLKEENEDLYLLVEDMTKKELDALLCGMTVSMSMRAII